jgi:hypothetical protein
LIDAGGTKAGGSKASAPAAKPAPKADATAAGGPGRRAKPQRGAAE